MKFRIPPVILVLILMAAMWLTARLLPGATLSIPWRVAVAAVVAFAGVVFAWAGVAEFRKAQTTVDPVRPERASQIVRSGVYSFSRNPMYLGFALVLLAWSINLGNVGSMLWIPVFVSYMNYFQIAAEEQALGARFGADFEAYARAVRRWL